MRLPRLPDFDLNISKPEYASQSGRQAGVQVFQGYLITLNNWENKIRDINVQNVALTETLRSMEDRAADILWSKCQEALSTNEEFDYGSYRERLERLCRSRGMFTATVTENMIKITCNIRRIGGDMQEYYEAVRLTRDALNIGVMPTEKGKGGRPKARGYVTASTLFYEKYYGAARLGRTILKEVRGELVDKTQQYVEGYRNVMSTREAFFTHVAPFWELLEFGILEVSDDVGGVSLVPASPTYFSMSATQEIEKLVNQNYQKKIQSLETRIREVLLSAEQLRQEITAKLDFLKKDTVRELVYKQLGNERRLKANVEKLETLISALTSGSNLPERYYLGKGVRIRTATLQKILEGL